MCCPAVAGPVCNWPYPSAVGECSLKEFVGPVQICTELNFGTNFITRVALSPEDVIVLSVECIEMFHS